MKLLETDYRPTPEDKARIKILSDMFKVSGDGVFATLQGEGLTTKEGGTAGLPVVFLRLHFCNLTCGFPTGWQCDTRYTWNPRMEEFWKEPRDWSINQTAVNIRQAWRQNHPQIETGHRLVISGGEPLLQQGKIVELIRDLSEFEIEIETNGTILPLPELEDCQFNCSPKLSGSGNSRKRRFHPDVITHIARLQKSWLKFVVTDLAELNEIRTIQQECQIPNEKIIVMPQGRSWESIQAQAQLLEPSVSERNWHIGYRHQLNWFGDQRGT